MEDPHGKTTIKTNIVNEVKKDLTRKKVTLSIKAIEAKEVIVLGDFNEWNPKAHPMKHNGNGLWVKSVFIPPGKYEYKFLIDGKWQEDPKNEQTSPNCFGTLNSVLNVG